MTGAHELTTEDMALVAYLKLSGCEYDEMRRSNGGCCWVFLATARIHELFDEYGRGEAYVEPREFVRKLGLVRREMYRFLDIKPRSVRARA